MSDEASPIVAALLRHPIAAVNMMLIIGSGFGLYHTVTSGLAEQSRQRDNIAALNQDRFSTITASVQAAITKADTNTARIEARAAYVDGKLSQQDIAIARLTENINILSRRLDRAQTEQR